MVETRIADFAAAQHYMREQRIDGWLVYDFRGNNGVFSQLLPGKRHLTRRVFLFIPAQGQPRLLAQLLDAASFRDLPIARDQYLGWESMRTWLAQTLAGSGRVAMEYCPGATLPVVSIVDAGTVELVRALGVEVVSSANLVQVCIARWSPAALEHHRRASRLVDDTKNAAFAMIRQRIAAQQGVSEWDVVEFIRGRFEADGLEWPDGPIVAVNEHSGDPHFEPSAASPAEIRRGDWVLIDLWARVPGDENIYSDITWCGVVDNQADTRQQRVFDAVRRARDAAVSRAQHAWHSGEVVQGWQLDEAAAGVIREAGFGEFIKHRTGHSLSPGRLVHGMGFNLDNLETRDTRVMLPGLGFTVEPGIYLPQFGVRLEIDVFVDPKEGPIVTSGIQNEPLRLG